MWRKLILTVLILVFVIIGVGYYIFFFQRDREIKSMEKQAGYLIQQVERYKNAYHKLPKNEEDMHLNLPDDYPFSYVTYDSLTYVVGFQIEPFRSLVYHSESKT